MKKNKVPKIAHFVFQAHYVDKLPTEWNSNVLSFIKHHPDYEIHIWNVDDIVSLMMDKYQHLIPIFISLKEMIQRFDFMRYLILYHYGGYYFDMDISWHNALPKILEKFHLILVKDNNYKIEGQLNNCFMGCIQNHPFMLSCIDSISFQINACNTQNYIDRTLEITGPVMFTKQFLKFVDISNTDDFLKWSSNIDVMNSKPYINTLKLIYIFPFHSYTNQNRNDNIFLHHMHSTWCGKEPYVKY